MGSVGIGTGDCSAGSAGSGHTQADHTGGRVVPLAMCLWGAGRQSGRAMLEPWTGLLSVAKILFLEVKVTSAWPGAWEGCWGERQESGRALPFDTDQWKSWRGELSPTRGCQAPPPPTDGAPGTGISFFWQGHLFPQPCGRSEVRPGNRNLSCAWKTLHKRRISWSFLNP